MEFIIDATTKKIAHGDVVELELDWQGRKVSMTASAESTLEEIAALILSQEFPSTPPLEFQKRIIIEAHQENGTLVLPGAPWIVDSVEVEQLPDERAADEFAALPGWATWTADEAAAWVQGDVVDLESAKVALTAMARAIVALRDWR